MQPVSDIPLSKRVLTQLWRGVFIVSLFAMSPFMALTRAPFTFILAGFSVLVGIYLIRTNPDEYELCLLLAAGIAALTVFVTPQFEHNRFGGYLDNPNIAGSVLGMIMIFAIVRRRWAYVVLFGAALTLGRSVGALMGILAATGFLLATNASVMAWIKHHKWLTALAILVGIGLLAGGLWTMFQVRDWWTERLDFYALTLKMIGSAPLTGHGLGSFRLSYFIISLKPHTFSGMLHPHAHNLYLQLGAEFGLPVPLAVILGGIGLFIRGNRAARASLLVIAVHSIVDATLLYPSVAYTFLMLMLPTLVLRVAAQRDTEVIRPAKAQPSQATR